MSLPIAIRRYLLDGLRAGPEVLCALLQHLPAEADVWDFRPDPGRFTLREALAHLAQWEGIHLARFRRMVEEAEPLLPDIDEGREAIENDYAHHDPCRDLAQFGAGRDALLGYLAALPDGAWERTGLRPPAIGRLTVTDYAVLIVGHDGYHCRQVAQWLQAWGEHPSTELR